MNDTDAFANLKAGMRAFMQDRDLFVQDLYVGTDEGYQIPVRIITQYAWHSLCPQFALSAKPQQTVQDSIPLSICPLFGLTPIVMAP
ncbi:MAG: phosphoenolpyruvate carboxykinase (ATP) [Deinococcales bacterium]